MNVMIPSNRHRQGIGLVYSLVILLALLLLASLAVDWGRVVLARVQLQQAADAAALSAATQMIGKTTSAARADAIEAANRNFAKLGDLSNTTLRSQDVVISKSRDNLPYNDTAQVTIRRAVPLAFASIAGPSSFEVEVTAKARFVPGVMVEQWVKGTANPYLSGMPEGTVASRNNPHNSPDYAGDVTGRRPIRQSPLPINNLPLVPGEALYFDEIAGTTQHDPNLPFYSPDGQTGEDGTPRDIGTNTAGAEHGISNLRAPINALVGVFLGPDQPDRTAPPAMLDYSSYESRHQPTYTPQLKQLFFIGDGMAKDAQGQNTIRQSFIVPEGATRLYLATWDFYEWNNNGGEREIRIERPGKVYLID